MKVLSIIGTRPQLIKAAAVTRALREDGRFREITVDTGQHYDYEMSQLLVDELEDVQRTRNLDIHGGTEHELLSRMIGALGDVLMTERPDFAIVYGDTNSTLAGALAASSIGCPLAHVEAGLRSFNPRMREERNRILTDRLADVLLCPTTRSVSNLEAEQATGAVHHVGDVMYDIARLARAYIERLPSDLLDRLGLLPRNYSIATIHRAETTDEPARLDEVLGYLRARAAERPVVFPMHPRTREAIDRGGHSTGGLLILPPVGYFDMTRLLASTTCVYTDSGGLQKEAYFHRVPCVTIRPETEWVETIAAGWNRLWTVAEYRPRREITDYGEGSAGTEIVRVLAQTSGAGS